MHTVTKVSDVHMYVMYLVCYENFQLTRPEHCFNLMLFSKLRAPDKNKFVCYKTRADTAMSLRQARQKS